MTNNNNNAPTKGPSALITTGATEAVSFETTSGLGSGNAANVTAETLNLINEKRTTRGLTEDVSFSDNISDTSEPETTNYHGCVCPSGYSPSSSIPTLPDNTAVEFNTSSTSKMTNVTINATKVSNTTTNGENTTVSELNTSSTLSTPTKIHFGRFWQLRHHGVKPF